MEYVEAAPQRACRRSGPTGLQTRAQFEAHRKRIDHLRSSSSNILVTPKGGVKLLDFGLAKLGSDATPLDDAALTRGITAAGTILGTLQYMSPEQLRVSCRCEAGFVFARPRRRDADREARVRRRSAGSVIASILDGLRRRSPPWPSDRRLLQRCLAKDPEERWQTARDIRAALDLIAQPSSNASCHCEDVPVGARRWPGRRRCHAAGLAALAFVHFREVPPRSDVVTFQIPAPENRTIASAPFLSPDGRSVAFVVASPDGVRSIAVRTLSSLTTRMLQGTENATENVIWSPDSRFIAFAADRTLKTLDLVGGAIRTVSDVGAAIGGGSWNADGTIIFSAFQRGIFQVAARGGVPSQLTTPAGSEYSRHAVVSADGRRFLYVAVETRDRKAEARLATLDGPAVHRFPLDRWRPSFVHALGR